MLRLVLALVLAGLLAPPAHALEFADFTTSGEDAISGTLLGSSISVTGSEIYPQYTDGSVNWFSGPYFTPPLAASDGFQIFSMDGGHYRIAFGAPVKDPTLQLNSLGSRFIFPPGTKLQVVSGHALLHVEDNVLVGATFTNSAGNPEDTSGTVRVLGTFEAVTFDTSYAGTDGVPMTVGGSVPDPILPKEPDAGGGGGVSDRDGDHVTDDADCEPDNAAVYPGAPDKPGDGVNQDCANGDAPMREIDRHIDLAYVHTGTANKVTELTVRKPRAGDTFRISCVRCAVKRASVPVTRNHRRLSLLRFVRGVRMHKGAVLRIRVDHPARISRIVTYRFRTPPKIPVSHERCLAPGAPRPVACRS